MAFKLFIVTYRVVGSRCNGSYVANVQNRREARRVVKAVDPDYVVDGVYTVEDWEKEIGCDPLEGVKRPRPGKCEYIESGT